MTCLSLRGAIRTHRVFYRITVNNRTRLFWARLARLVTAPRATTRVLPASSPLVRPRMGESRRRRRASRRRLKLGPDPSPNPERPVASPRPGPGSDSGRADFGRAETRRDCAIGSGRACASSPSCGRGPIRGRGCDRARVSSPSRDRRRDRGRGRGRGSGCGRGGSSGRGRDRDRGRGRGRGRGSGSGHFVNTDSGGSGIIIRYETYTPSQ